MENPLSKDEMVAISHKEGQEILKRIREATNLCRHSSVIVALSQFIAAMTIESVAQVPGRHTKDSMIVTLSDMARELVTKYYEKYPEAAKNLRKEE